ncbi:MAG: hypothetical protein JRI41_08375, partial [Deltaproteobacteria bacterium]|nr:hypothetical protein [Deltaproteobacteria bacterium]
MKNDLTESWLQELLDNSPDLLPVNMIDDRIDPPLFSLGREITNPSGAIDNLFLSRSGHVVLVETKLWRNPESRRQVVAQIIDYAGHVRKWDYAKLCSLWSSRHTTTSSLWASVAPEEDEQDWVDRVSRNLEGGRMALLIVGDGIKSQTQQLADSVSGHADFPFRLGLVELRLYDLENNKILVMPSIIARTQEIERAVVRIVYSDGKYPDVVVEVPDSPRDRRSLSRQSFLVEIGRSTSQECADVAERILELLESSDLQIEWKTSSLAVKALVASAPEVLFSLVVVKNNGQMYTYKPWLSDQVIRAWKSEEIADQLLARQEEFFLGIGGRKSSSGN